VFLDRDGVVNELVWNQRAAAYESPYDADQVALAPGAADAVAALRGVGLVLVAASNQPAAAKGYVGLEQLRAVHDRLVSLLRAAGAELDDYRYCFHHPEGVDAQLGVACACRKPRPGMLLDAARAIGLDLGRSWMVGDSDIDVEAGQAAGCRTVLIENPRSAHRRRGEVTPDARAPDLVTAARVIAGAAE